MSEITQPMPIRPVTGGVGFLLGGAALLIVLVHFVAGPFGAHPETSVTLGELTSDIGKSAFRDFFGLKQPDARPIPWDIDRALRAAIMGLGGLAVILGLTALIRRENRVIAACATALGISAILVQLFAMALMIIACVLIITAFFAMIGEWSPF